MGRGRRVNNVCYLSTHYPGFHVAFGEGCKFSLSTNGHWWVSSGQLTDLGDFLVAPSTKNMNTMWSDSICWGVIIECRTSICSTGSSAACNALGSTFAVEGG